MNLQGLHFVTFSLTSFHFHQYNISALVKKGTHYFYNSMLFINKFIRYSEIG